MSNRYLTMDISYKISDNSFNITGNVNANGQVSLLETFLREQMGKGKDESPANEQDVYHITLKWFPQNDDIKVSYDTGNKSLRDGILATILNRLGGEDE